MSLLEAGFIPQCFCGMNFTIYASKDFSVLFSAGDNRYGQCCVESTDDKINQLTPITFFRDNAIRIRGICTNPNSASVFFIDVDDNVYAAGSILFGAVGPVARGAVDEGHPRQIQLIEELSQSNVNGYVIEVQVGFDFAVALCLPDFGGLHALGYFLRTSGMGDRVPLDVLHILGSFIKTSNVFSTSFVDTATKGWSEIKIEDFGHKRILQVATGSDHSLFLDTANNLWSCGTDSYDDYLQQGRGVLGLENNPLLDEEKEADMTSIRYGDQERRFVVQKPRQITYFTDRNIKIKDIQCGANYSVALSDDGKVFVWGWLDYDSLGGFKMVFGATPQPILPTVKARRQKWKNDHSGNSVLYVSSATPDEDYKVDLVRCGSEHFYVRTECGKHFMNGNDIASECRFHSFNGASYADMELLEDEQVLGVFPGQNDTKVVFGPRTSKQLRENGGVCMQGERLKAKRDVERLGW